MLNYNGLIKTKFILIIVFSIYLYAALYSLKNPGLYYDEALQVVPAIDLIYKNPDNNYIKTWHPFGYPVMTLPYIGALKSYIFYPVFLSFGISVYSIRIVTITIGFLTLIFTYLFTLRFLNRQTALLASIFLATDCSYVFYCKVDWGPVVLMLLLKMIGFFLILLFLESGKSVFLTMAFFAFGLGVWDKASFLWIIFTLIFIALIYHKMPSSRLNLHNIECSILGFIIGAFPFIVFNLKFQGATFQGMGFNFTEVTNDFFCKMTKLVETLNGKSVFYNIFSRMPDEAFFGGSLFFILFLVTLFVLPFLLYRKDKKFNMKIKAIFFFMVVNYLFIILSPKATGHHHSMILYPIPQIFSAAIFVKMLSIFKFDKQRLFAWKNWLRIMILSILAVTFISNLSLIKTYHRQFEEVGGRGGFSPAVYELVDFLDKLNDSHIILMDWGLNQNLISLTAGELSMKELFFYENSEKEKIILDELNKYGELIVIVYSWSSESDRLINDLARIKNLNLEIIISILDKKSHEIYKIYSLEKP
jgi:4-amino-4-deoxy-L-arabinose transferase-like glycosyltransferase